MKIFVFKFYKNYFNNKPEAYHGEWKLLPIYDHNNLYPSEEISTL